MYQPERCLTVCHQFVHLFGGAASAKASKNNQPHRFWRAGTGRNRNQTRPVTATHTHTQAIDSRSFSSISIWERAEKNANLSPWRPLHSLSSINNVNSAWCCAGDTFISWTGALGFLLLIALFVDFHHGKHGGKLGRAVCWQWEKEYPQAETHAKRRKERKAKPRFLRFGTFFFHFSACSATQGEENK